jgi:hypothetical protein
MILGLFHKTYKQSFSDYRPINVLPFVSKILEILMLKQMQYYFDTKCLFPSHQSGFRKGHGTETALLKLTSDIFRGSGSGKCTVLVSLDFSKAYDCVPHSNLIDKLSSKFSFSNYSSQLIASYLRNRSQMVVAKGGQQSDILWVFRGMPQGGNLCCLLFSAYLDLPSILSCNYCAFADDIQIYVSGVRSNLPDMVSLLNENLNRIVTWCSLNGLALNPSKTRAIVFQPRPPSDDLPRVSMLNTLIPYSESLEILGLTLKHDLSWDLQAAKICKRTQFILHNLYRFKQYLSLELKTRLFKQLILPHFLYASTVFSGSLSGSNVKTLNRALRCGVRFVFDRGRRDSISPLILELLSLPFERLLQERRLLMMFKILRFHHYPRYLKPMLERGTSRRTCLLLIPELSSSWSYKCPIRVAITEWNKVDAAYRQSTDISGFRKLLHTYLMR